MKFSYRQALWLCIFTIHPLSHAGQDIRQDLSFSAVRVEYDKNVPDYSTKSRIFMSSEGVREESMPDSADNTLPVINIINFKVMKSWLIFPGRKFYAEMDGGEVSDDPEDADVEAGLLNAKPCESSRSAESKGTVLKDNRKLEVWICANADGVLRTQWFDPTLKIIVRDEAAAGYVAELRDIRHGKQPASLFKPPSDYRKVSLKEFMTGVPDFPLYQEGDPPIPDEPKADTL